MCSVSPFLNSPALSDCACDLLFVLSSDYLEIDLVSTRKQKAALQSLYVPHYVEVPSA